MRAKLLLLPLACFALLSFPTVSTWGGLITFDDLSESATGSFLANGYQGLVWSNFFCFNAILATNRPEVGVSGFYYGMVSASNVAYDANGGSAQLSSPGTNFNFLSAYLTGAYNSNLNIEVQGFSGTNLLYDQLVVAGATNPTLFTFNYQNINRLHFNCFGGQPAFDGGGAIFVMDNFTFEFVPEPSSLLLATAGALLLCPLLKRKRV
jgi:hypothetical protein